MIAARGNRVRIRCLVRDDERRIVDDGSLAVEFVIGKNQALAAIENAVLGHAAGERVDFVCAPQDAYGDFRPELVFEAVRENLPPGETIEVGAILHPGGGNGRFPLRVIELTERGARLDGNHPLASKTLRFSLEVLKVSCDGC